jgi:BirA family transcriptional regulator, biotin operon repressor / biotin---[acetyl-CoA-carboxylase] ligase
MMDDNILQLLRKHPLMFLSGEEISRRLKVSRTAVWKKIERLRSQGYEIEASTRSGYRLVRSPDLLTPLEVGSNLKTKWMGRKIHYFHSLDSTNTKAYQLAMDGAGEGEVIIAESQEKGKGRMGRQWFSPPFVNLYLSIILRPKILPHQASLMTLMAAIATTDAIQKYSGLAPSIKWPNDILLQDRKVAGLLNEILSETDRIHFMILGIGVNLNMDKKTFPKEIRARATSLKIETGQTVSRKAFLQTLLQELEDWYTVFLKKGSFSVLNAWRDRTQIKGRQIKVVFPGETLKGVAVDIDSDGALILRTRDGSRRRILAGDVEYSRE